MDYPGAEKGVQAFEKYMTPPEVSAPLSIENSAVDSASSN
jgi:hypothetical protein